MKHASTNVRSQARASATRAALGCAALLVALQVAAKSARDALFCAAYSPADLPKAMVFGAVLSALAALGVTRVYRAFGPARVVPLLLLLNGAAFGTEFALFDTHTRTVVLVLYVHVATGGAIIISGFWSVVSERFDPHALRTSMSRIGFGAAVGGLLGGVFAERVSAMAGPRSTLVAMAVLSVFGAAAMSVFARPIPTHHAPSVPPPAAGAAAAAAHVTAPYLKRLSVFVGLTALTSSVIDFAFKARAMEHFASATELIPFFALFYTASNLVALVVQGVITPRLLEKEGLEVALASLPVTLVAAGIGALLLPGLTTQTLLRGADSALTASLYRSAYEPLYTPLAADKKRAAKAVIDVVVDKIGDGIGSFLSWGLVLLLPAQASFGATGVALVAALVTLFIAVRLHQGYVAELASSLRSGNLVLDVEEVRDKTTRLTLSRTELEIDRERLLNEIKNLRDREKPGPTAFPLAKDSELSNVLKVPEPQKERDFPRLVADLLSDDVKRITDALAEPIDDVKVVGFLIPLVARNDVAGPAMNALAAFGDRITGHLGDTLLDPGTRSARVRRRVARVLMNSGGARAIPILITALEDPDFGVRRQVARTLENLAIKGHRIPLDRSRVSLIADKDLGLDSSAPRIQRIEHAFTVLGLAYDREALFLAYKALVGSDFKLRGTALEYLENVLPEAVRKRIFALINAEPVSRPKRAEGELLQELKRTLG